MGSSAPRSISFAIAGPIAQSDLPGLCARVCRLLDNGVEVVLCDVAGVAADAVSVDALARLRLAARQRRAGRPVSVARKNVNSTTWPCSISIT